MPSTQKLLTAAPASTTGVGIRTAMGGLPFTFRTQGGYTVQGISVQGSFDSTNGSDGTWVNLQGTVVTQGGAATEVKEIVGIPDLSTININYPVPWIRAVTVAGQVGNATVWITMTR